MKDRGGDQKTVNGNRRRSGKHKPLQPRHAVEFNDEDYYDDCTNQEFKDEVKLFNKFARSSNPTSEFVSLT